MRSNKLARSLKFQTTMLLNACTICRVSATRSNATKAKFEDKVFFESDAMCGNSGNEFYKIGQVQNRLLVVESLMIAGRTRRVTKIMTYKRHWMVNNYFAPMNQLANRFNPQRQLVQALQDSDCVIS